MTILGDWDASSATVTLQFGEFANASMIHVWNALAAGKYSPAYTRRFLEESLSGAMRPRVCVVGDAVGHRGILQTYPLSQSTPLDVEDEHQQLLSKRTGRWTDFNFAMEFSCDRNYYELPVALQNDPIHSFAEAYYGVSGIDCVVDEVEERMRQLVEACDVLERLNVVGEHYGLFGAIQLKTMQRLQDEYSKTHVIVVGSQQKSVFSEEKLLFSGFETATVDVSLQMALTQQLLCDKRTITCMPIFEKLHQVTENYPRWLSPWLADVFISDSVPGRGRFATLKGYEQVWATEFVDFFDTTMHALPASFRIPSTRTHHIWKGTDWEAVDLVSWADFNPKPFANRSLRLIETLETATWPSALRAEFSAAELRSEIVESLHQLVDMDEASEDTY